MILRKLTTLILLLTGISNFASAYPIDSYLHTGIRRLWYQHEVVLGAMNGRMPVTGAMLIMDSIRLTFLDDRQEMMRSLPPVDEEFQTQLEELFPYYRDRYSVSILDITPGKEVRYAEREPMIGYQPGSVGKLAVLAALFCELENIYVDCYDDRWMLMRTKVVPAGQWAVYDHHTVPFFDTEKRNFYKRQVAPTDEMTLYEWADHMVSVSNNGAASVLWREVILMRVFQQDYPELTREEAEEYFRKTDRRELMDLATDVVSCPLRALGITSDEWRLGQMFTRGATDRIPGQGGSIGTTRGLMKFLLALENGRVIDHKSDLEMKRLMYATDRRIRYASSSVLDSAAVYFKSGILYGCSPSLPGSCGEYAGNKMNYMNSVAIVEQSDGTKYIVVLMTNVLSKNSAWDHRRLAAEIDAMLRPEEEQEAAG